jgi:hypothetical protein
MADKTSDQQEPTTVCETCDGCGVLVCVGGEWEPLCWYSAQEWVYGERVDDLDQRWCDDCVHDIAINDGRRDLAGLVAQKQREFLDGTRT